MTVQVSGVIRQSELLGRLVLDRKTAEEVGRVDRLWLDPKAHQIVGMTCLSGLVKISQHRLTWSQIEVIGAEGILVQMIEGVKPEKPSTVETEVGQEVWTDQGSCIGTLTDYRFDPETGDVVDYLFTPNGWRGIQEGSYRLLPQALISMSDKRVIIPASAAQTAEPHGGGLKQGVSHLTGFLKQDYSRTQQDLKTIASHLQASTQQATEQLKDKLFEVVEQFQPPDQADAPEKTPDLQERDQGEVVDVQVIDSRSIAAEAAEPELWTEPVDRAGSDPTVDSSQARD